MVIAADLVVEVEAHHQEVAEVVQEVSHWRISLLMAPFTMRIPCTLKAANNNGAMCAPPMN